MASVSPRRFPYQGLDPYEADDAPFFFGREKETRLIAANLFAAPLTLVYGASGVGKSSVLRAGVVNHLRRRDDLLVVEFHTWHGNPLNDLKTAVMVALTCVQGVDAPPAESASLAAYLAACAARVDRSIMVLLDQFEEYFLYHAQDDTFAAEFAAAVGQADVPVSFLIGIREDVLARLDRFEGRIPTLFDNYLRLEHLDRIAARAAIEGPILQYNQRLTAEEPAVQIEPELVEAVLRQLETGQVILGDTGRGVGIGKAEVTEARIETPYLQLVMTRLWEAEMRAGSRVLRLETLNGLGGAERIVRTHLDAVMSALLPNEQDIAASVFHYLVTPSGTKITHSLPDLADYAQRPQAQLEPVLEKLSRGDDRIIRPVAPPPDQPDIQRYEIFHDVLAEPILDWRLRYVQAQDRADAEKQAANKAGEQARAGAVQRLRRIAIAAFVQFVLFLLFFSVGVFLVYYILPESDPHSETTIMGILGLFAILQCLVALVTGTLAIKPILFERRVITVYTGAAEQDVYIGFWLRLCAEMIDILLLLLVQVPVLLWVYGWVYFTSDSFFKGTVDILVGWIFPVIATILFWIYKSATPGKMVISAKIVDVRTGQKPSNAQFIGRYLAYLLSLLLLGVGFLWIAFDRKKQGWHDKLARTVVVRAEPS